MPIHSVRCEPSAGTIRRAVTLLIRIVSMDLAMRLIDTMPKCTHELTDAYAADTHQEAEEDSEACAPPAVFFEEVVHSCLAPPIWLHHEGEVSCIIFAHLAMKQAVAYLAIGVALGAAICLLISVVTRWAEVDAKLLHGIEVRL